MKKKIIYCTAVLFAMSKLLSLDLVFGNEEYENKSAIKILHQNRSNILDIRRDYIEHDRIHEKAIIKIAQIEKQIEILRSMSYTDRLNILVIDGWWSASISFLNDYINFHLQQAPDLQLVIRAYFLRSLLLGDQAYLFPGNEVVYTQFPRLFPIDMNIESVYLFPELIELAKKDIHIYLKFYPLDQDALMFTYYLEDALHRNYH